MWHRLLQALGIRKRAPWCSCPKMTGGTGLRHTAACQEKLKEYTAKLFARWDEDFVRRLVREESDQSDS